VTNKKYHWSPDFWQQWLANAPILCVDAVIKQQDQVVLVKRATKPFQGSWHLPGGLVRKNETLSDALKRVIATEVGLVDFQVVKQVGIFDEPQRDPRGHFITVAFLVTTQETIPAINQQGEAVALFKTLPAELGFDTKKIWLASKKLTSNSEN